MNHPVVVAAAVVVSFPSSVLHVSLVSGLGLGIGLGVKVTELELELELVMQMKPEQELQLVATIKVVDVEA